METHEEKINLLKFRDNLRRKRKGFGDETLYTPTSSVTSDVVIEFDRIERKYPPIDNVQNTADRYHIVADVAERYTGISQFDEGYMNDLINSGAKYYSIDHNLGEIGSGITQNLEFQATDNSGSTMNNRESSDER